MKLLPWIFATAFVGLCLANASAQQNAPKELSIEATIPTPAAHMAFGFDALWTISDGKMVRINAADNGVVEIELPLSENGGHLMELDKYRGFAIGEGAVWVPDIASSTIIKISPEKNEPVLTIPTDIFGSKGNIGVGEGSVWVITFDTHDKTLTRYDSETGTVQAQIALPNAGAGVLVAYGSVWVTAASRNELYKIDPSSNQIEDMIDLHDASHLLTDAAGSVWVAYDTDGIVQRIDGSTGELLASIETGARDMEQDGDITSGGEYVWTINRGSIVAQIDTRTNAAKGTFRAPLNTSTGRRIRHGSNSLWLSGNAIYRVTPPN